MKLVDILAAVLLPEPAGPSIAMIIFFDIAYKNRD